MRQNHSFAIACAIMLAAAAIYIQPRNRAADRSGGEYTRRGRHVHHQGRCSCSIAPCRWILSS